MVVSFIIENYKFQLIVKMTFSKIIKVEKVSDIFIFDSKMDGLSGYYQNYNTGNNIFTNQIYLDLI